MKLGMVIKASRCIGCDACTVSCKTFNGLGPGMFYRHVRKMEKGTYPNARRVSIPTLCNHCENAACERVCPTGATYKDDKGRVEVDIEKCIGCRMCMAACPYNARTFNWSAPKSWFPINNDAENVVDASIAQRHVVGTVEKCNMCKGRTDQGLDPMCVHNCPANALVFGDLDDPTSTVSKLIAHERVYVLLPEQGTNPQVYYLDQEGANHAK